MSRYLLVAVCCMGLAIGLEVTASDAEMLERGRERYKNDCAACHGISATGDGPVAAVLTRKPTDLTVLTEQNRGEFPEAYVRRVIDGRDLPVSAHGQVAMPVWGQHYSRGTLAYSEKNIQIRIDELVAHLQFIQTK